MTLNPDSAQYLRGEKGKWVGIEDGGVTLVGKEGEVFSWGKDSGEQAETVCRRKGIPGGGKDKSKGK